MRNANALTFVSHLLLRVLHILSRVPCFTCWEVIASSLRKNSGEQGPEKEKIIEGSSFSPCPNPPNRMSQESTLVFRWKSEEANNTQVRSRFGDRTFFHFSKSHNCWLTTESWNLWLEREHTAWMCSQVLFVHRQWWKTSYLLRKNILLLLALDVLNTLLGLSPKISPFFLLHPVLPFNQSEQVYLSSNTWGYPILGPAPDHSQPNW